MKTIPRIILVATLGFLFPTVNVISQCAPPVYFGMMVHLEDNWDDNVNLSSFNNHALQLRMAVGFVKPYGAKYTAECAIPFAEGCINWGANVLQSLIDSSMGVGSHCGSSSEYVYTKYLVDQLVDTSNNRGISGGWGPGDTTLQNNWADSAYTAGYKYLDAPVYLTYLQIPQNQRPDSVSDLVILDSLFHNPAPYDFNERVHPHRINSAFTWHTDTTGQILFLTGSLGEIHTMAEGGVNCIPTCVLDSADIDTIINYVNQAINIAHTSNKFTVVYLHTPLHTYMPGTKIYYDYLFQRLAPFVASGELEYKTMGEIYDGFIQCEQMSAIAADEIADSSIIIYPNPSTGLLNIDVQNFNNKAYSIDLYDMSGRMIYQLQIPGSNPQSTVTIDLSQQSPGIYYIKLTTDKEVISRKIIKYGCQ